ncbi:MAG: prephenate dehydratase [SAR202 cluster bacterium]|jgi:prephenate dehydratase|nr:prephenate dehydratase [SAR202 cluster bacterium]
MPKRLAFFGPHGTHTEQASLNYDGEAVLLPYSTIPLVAAAVDSGEADEGVVPIENSVGGSLSVTLDLLIHGSSLFIRQEIILPIKHFLVGRPGTRFEDIDIIYSHHQALEQCRSYLAEHFDGVREVLSTSTASAVEDMLTGDGRAAAIATERAAKLYDAEVLASGIADYSNNTTRFVVLASADHPPTGDDKTSICFTFDGDNPGVLHSALGELASRNINLTKIESRPTRVALGEYIFLVDLQGHREDETVKSALSSLREIATIFKIFGSYPRSS